jgi:hypothetical protein
MASVAVLTLKVDPEYLRYLQMRVALEEIHKLAVEEAFNPFAADIREAIEDLFPWLTEPIA